MKNLAGAFLLFVVVSGLVFLAFEASDREAKIEETERIEFQKGAR